LCHGGLSGRTRRGVVVFSENVGGLNKLIRGIWSTGVRHEGLCQEGVVSVASLRVSVSLSGESVTSA
jgi:hypothetical protein